MNTKISKKILAILVLLGSYSLIAETEKSTLLEKLLKQSNYIEAELEAQKLIKEFPNNQQYQFALAQIYNSTQRYDDAEEYIEKVLAHTNLDEGHWLMASAIYGNQAQASSIFSQLGYAKKAKKSLESLLKLNPKNENGLIGLIQFHIAAPGIAGGDEDEIPALMARLKTVNPIRYTLMQAQQHFAEDDIDKGLEVIELGLEQAPNSIELLFVKAIQLGNTGGQQEAFDIFSGIQKIKLNKDASNQEKSWHQMSIYQAAKVSAEHGVSLEQGKNHMYAFMDSEQTQVEEAWIRFRLGQILWQLNDKSSAKAQFELIPSLKPDERLSKLMKAFKKKHRIKL